MPEMVDAFLGRESTASLPRPILSPRRLVAAVIVPAWLAILAAQFTAMGRLTSSLTGLAPETALIAGAGLIVLYALLGGQAAVIRSDVPQFAMLLAGWPRPAPSCFSGSLRRCGPCRSNWSMNPFLRPVSAISWP